MKKLISLSFILLCLSANASYYKNRIAFCLNDEVLDKKCGYINSNGDIVIKPQFERASNFTDNGLAKVKKKGKYGYINIYGTMMIEPQFDNAWSFLENGLAKVKIDDSYGYINYKGNIIIQLNIDNISDIDHNDFIQTTLNNEIQLNNSAGKYVAKINTICGKQVLMKANNKIIYPQNYTIKNNCKIME